MTKRLPTFRSALLGFVLSVCGIALALPPQNAKSPRASQPVADERGTEQDPLVVKQVPIDADQRGTGQQPLVVKTASVSKPPDETLRAEANEAQHISNEQLTARSTLALASVTAILAFFTYRLWVANKTLVVNADNTAARQSGEMQASIAEATRAATAMESVAAATKANAALMQDILYKQMRAYVSVTTGIATYQDAQNNFGSKPVITNTGLSPARNVTTRVAAQILDTKSVEVFDFPLPEESIVTDATLSARQDFTIWGIVKEHFDEADVKQIMTGEPRRLFVWDVVTYDDVFGGHWQTRFCHNFNWFTPADGAMKINAAYYKRHNDST